MLVVKADLHLVFILVNPHGIIVIVFQTKMLLILKYTLQIKDELLMHIPWNRRICRWQENGHIHVEHKQL